MTGFLGATRTVTWKSQRKKTSNISELVSGFIRVSDKDFFGQFVKSPNARYTLAWQDGHCNSTKNGATKRIAGRFLLLDADTVVVDSRMARPNDGKVSDSGVFIIHDWTDHETLGGVFHAFNARGDSLVKMKYAANLFNNGLSGDGSLAVCQTANSSNSDGSILTIFDLTKGDEVARWRAESGWADRYEFPGGDVLRLVYRDGEKCDYNFNGQFADREQWIASRIAKGDLQLIEAAIKEAQGEPKGELLARVLEGTKASLSDADSHPSTRSLALKLRGLCLENEGALKDALDCYDRALALNPKIGVKQRADRLRKTIPSG